MIPCKCDILIYRFYGDFGHILKGRLQRIGTAVGKIDVAPVGHTSPVCNLAPALILCPRAGKSVFTDSLDSGRDANLSQPCSLKGVFNNRHYRIGVVTVCPTSVGE